MYFVDLVRDTKNISKWKNGKKSPEKRNATLNYTDRASRSAMARELISSSRVVANLLENNILYCYFSGYLMGTIRDGMGGGGGGTGFGVRCVH